MLPLWTLAITSPYSCIINESTYIGCLMDVGIDGKENTLQGRFAFGWGSLSGKSHFLDFTFSHLKQGKRWNKAGIWWCQKGNANWCGNRTALGGSQLTLYQMYLPTEGHEEITPATPVRGAPIIKYTPPQTQCEMFEIYLKGGIYTLRDSQSSHRD